MKAHGNISNDVLTQVSAAVQAQTVAYANWLRSAYANTVVTAGPQDAWDIAWDCNTDACEIEDLYRKNGKSQRILERVIDHPHATPNAVRAVCMLLWRDYGKKARPELVAKCWTAFKYIKTEQAWIRELARLGNIRAALEIEEDRMKSLLHDCGDLGDVLEEANRILGPGGIDSQGNRIGEASRRMVASAEVLANVHRETGATVTQVHARR
jgi:hypothetical protein